MVSVESLAQVIYLVLATGGMVLGLEVLLFWFFYQFQRRGFVWLSTLGGFLLGAAFSVLSVWTAAGGEEDVAAEGFLAALSWADVASFAGVFWVVGLLAKHWLRGRYRLPALMIAPAFLVVALLVVYPFVFEFRLAFGNLNLYTINQWLGGGELGWSGFRNFLAVFTTSPLQTISFWGLLGRTLAWTGINLICHVGFGLGLALLLNRPIKGKGLYRTLLIIPWAMPQVVAVLAWRGEFHPQFGFVNVILHGMGITGVNWWSDPIPVFLSCCIVNIWLGIPFMMIVFLGGLQAIPSSYYEAASIDGASPWRQFREITLPLLRPVVVPSVTLGTIWTFNNINVIYLMTGQNGGNEYADILISALYKSAFSYSRYSFSAAFAVVIFLLLIGITLVWMKVSKGTESQVAR